MLSQRQITYIIDHHIQRSHAKSGGHGGQHVNKRETKAEGYLDIPTCPFVSDEHKARLLSTYHNHTSKEGVLRLTCQEQRHLHRNMELLKKHFRVLFLHMGKQSLFDVLHHH